MFQKQINQIRLIYNKILWKKRNKHNSTYPVNCFDIEKVTVGKETYGPIHAITYPCEGSALKIGHYCSIGGNVTFILGGEHPLNFVSTYPFGQRIVGDRVDTISKGPILIDDDVWIGQGATILSGVHIGQGAVIGASAVVCSDVAPYSIVAGNPAKVIRRRFSEEKIQELLQIDYSKIDKDLITNHISDLSREFTDAEQIRWMIHNTQSNLDEKEREKYHGKV